MNVSQGLIHTAFGYLGDHSFLTVVTKEIQVVQDIDFLPEATSVAFKLFLNNISFTNTRPLDYDYLN